MHWKILLQYTKSSNLFTGLEKVLFPIYRRGSWGSESLCDCWRSNRELCFQDATLSFIIQLISSSKYSSSHHISVRTISCSLPEQYHKCTTFHFRVPTKEGNNSYVTFFSSIVLWCPYLPTHLFATILLRRSVLLQTVLWRGWICDSLEGHVWSGQFFCSFYIEN